MKIETNKEAKVQSKSSSGRTHGAIDPHTHILPEAFIEDVRQGRFGQRATIEPDRGSETIVTRGRVLGKDFEFKSKLRPLHYKPETRLIKPIHLRGPAVPQEGIFRHKNHVPGERLDPAKVRHQRRALGSPRHGHARKVRRQKLPAVSRVLSH